MPQQLDVPLWVWIATLGAFLAIVIADLAYAIVRPHLIGAKEAAIWVLFYVGLAAAFGFAILSFGGTAAGAEFAAGYITEYSLSIDNLFVFVIIITKFAVPDAYVNKVLIIGIALSLVLRGVFIALGAAAIERFSWTFYFFGALLIYTAYKLATEKEEEGNDFSESPMIKAIQKVIPTSAHYSGGGFRTVENGKKMFTPLMIVMVAIMLANVVFALDSIPAIFGLTKDPFIVFTANAFALMGLRQLYFLIGDLLQRLRYLSYGLAVILGFIGVKLIFEALHGSHIENVGPIPIPTIGIAVSLGFIVATLVITTVLSLMAAKKDPHGGHHLPPAAATASTPNPLKHEAEQTDYTNTPVHGDEPRL